jgi:hypothetical protein
MNATRRTTLWAASALLISAHAAMLPAYASPAPVNLGEAGNYTILAKTGISTTGHTHIIGNLGLSPAKTSFYTGFGQSLAPSGQYSISPTYVSGHLYAADNTPPTPSNLTTAVGNMQAAFTDAAGRAADALNAGSAGEIGGLNLTAGVYSWTTSSNVTIHSDLTLSGSATDVWIFQIPGTLDLGSASLSGIHIVLSGGAQAKNIFWKVSGDTTVHNGCVFYGNILDQTLVALDAGAVLNGKALAQTAVTLIADAVSSSSAGAAGPSIPPVEAILFPSPAKGGSVTVAYKMSAAGTAYVMVWNDRGDLVAKVQQQQLAGPQTIVVPVGAFAPGVYLYRVDLHYPAGDNRSDVKKFTVVK